MTRFPSHRLPTTESVITVENTLASPPLCTSKSTWMVRELVSHVG